MANMNLVRDVRNVSGMVSAGSLILLFIYSMLEPARYGGIFTGILTRIGWVAFFLFIFAFSYIIANPDKKSINQKD